MNSDFHISIDTITKAYTDKIEEQIKQVDIDDPDYKEKTEELKNEIQKIERTLQTLLTKNLKMTNRYLNIIEKLDIKKTMIQKYIERLNFKIENYKCIFDYICVYRDFIDEELDSDVHSVVKVLFDSVYQKILNFKHNDDIKNMSDDETKGYIKAMQNNYYNSDYYKYITYENHIKAISLGFKDIEEPVEILRSLYKLSFLYVCKDEEYSSIFDYGYGKLLINNEIIGYGFKDLMFIIEGPIIQNVFKVLNVTYEFIKEVSYITYESEWRCPSGYSSYGGGAYGSEYEKQVKVNKTMLYD